LSEGSEQGLKTYEEGSQFLDERGFLAVAMDNRAEMLRVLADLGEWGQVIERAEELLEWSTAHHQDQTSAKVLVAQVQVLFWRGEKERSRALQGRLEELGRRIGDHQVLVPSLALSALIEQGRGHTSRALELIGELDRVSSNSVHWRAHHLPTAARVLVSAGWADRAEEFVAELEVIAWRDRNCLLTGRAVVAEAKQERETAVCLYDDAAGQWAEFGFALEHGQALLGAARCSLALGRRDDALPRLHRAREIFTKLDARPLIGEVDANIQKATALSS
jgi:tetratricopeptide (TPR) repeat protein